MKSIDCDTKSIGQIKQKPKTRLKEHQVHFKNNQKERSAIAKHCIKSGHYFQNKFTLRSTKIKVFISKQTTKI